MFSLHRFGGVRCWKRQRLEKLDKKFGKKFRKAVDQIEKFDILTIPLDKRLSAEKVSDESPEQLIFDSLILVCRFGKIQNVLYSKKHIQQMLDSAFFR